MVSQLRLRLGLPGIAAAQRHYMFDKRSGLNYPSCGTEPVRSKFMCDSHQASYRNRSPAMNYSYS